MKNKATLELDLRVLYFSLSFIYLVIAISTNNFVFTKEFYFNAFGNQLNDVRIEAMIQSAIKNRWVNYIVIPVILILKMFIISGVIYAGVIISELAISYKMVLRIVMIAESMMVLVALFKFCYFIITGNMNVEDLKSFYPLSVISLVNIEKLPSYFIYPLQILNVFEVGYWLILIFSIEKVSNMSFGSVFKLIASTYGVSIIIWVFFIVFIQLQLS